MTIQILLLSVFSGALGSNNEEVKLPSINKKKTSNSSIDSKEEKKSNVSELLNNPPEVPNAKSAPIMGENKYEKKIKEGLENLGKRTYKKESTESTKATNSILSETTEQTLLSIKDTNVVCAKPQNGGIVVPCKSNEVIVNLDSEMHKKLAILTEYADLEAEIEEKCHMITFVSAMMHIFHQKPQIENIQELNEGRKDLNKILEPINFNDLSLNKNKDLDYQFRPIDMNYFKQFSNNAKDIVKNFIISTKDFSLNTEWENGKHTNTKQLKKDKLTIINSIVQNNISDNEFEDRKGYYNNASGLLQKIRKNLDIYLKNNDNKIGNEDFSGAGFLKWYFFTCLRDLKNLLDLKNNSYKSEVYKNIKTIYGISGFQKNLDYLVEAYGNTKERNSEKLKNYSEEEEFAVKNQRGVIYYDENKNTIIVALRGSKNYLDWQSNYDNSLEDACKIFKPFRDLLKENNKDNKDVNHLHFVQYNLEKYIYSKMIKDKKYDLDEFNKVLKDISINIFEDNKNNDFYKKVDEVKNEEDFLIWQKGLRQVTDGEGIYKKLLDNNINFTKKTLEEQDAPSDWLEGLESINFKKNHEEIATKLKDSEKNQKEKKEKLTKEIEDLRKKHHAMINYFENYILYNLPKEVKKKFTELNEKYKNQKINDFETFIKNNSKINFRMHRGFGNLADSIMPDLITQINNLKTKHSGAKVIFTGHDQGAAVAVIAATLYNFLAKNQNIEQYKDEEQSNLTPTELKNIQAYVFSMPRTFDESGAQWVNAYLGEKNLIRQNVKGDVLCEMDPLRSRLPMNLGDLTNHFFKDIAESNFAQFKKISEWHNSLQTKILKTCMEAPKWIVELGVTFGFQVIGFPSSFSKKIILPILDFVTEKVYDGISNFVDKQSHVGLNITLKEIIQEEVTNQVMSEGLSPKSFDSSHTLNLLIRTYDRLMHPEFTTEFFKKPSLLKDYDNFARTSYGQYRDVGFLALDEDVKGQLEIAKKQISEVFVRVNERIVQNETKDYMMAKDIAEYERAYAAPYHYLRWNNVLNNSEISYTFNSDLATQKSEQTNLGEMISKGLVYKFKQNMRSE